MNSHFSRCTDFASYLRLKLDERKAAHPQYSMRRLAAQCGLRSPAALSMMLSGARLPSAETLSILLAALKTDAAESRFAETLVAWERARHSAEGRSLLEKLDTLRAGFEVQRAEATFLRQGLWFLPLLLEMVNLPDFVNDPRWIISRLRFPLTESEVRFALNFLVETNVLTRNSDGSLSRGGRDLELPGGDANAAIRAYHRSMLGLAQQSLELPVSDRFISGLTVNLTPEEYEELTSEVTAFLRRIMARHRGSSGGRVFQVQLQVFPMTRPGP